MRLTKKRMIEILKDAEDAFGEKPKPELFNSSGLCYFLKSKYGLNKYQMKRILSKYYSNSSYTIVSAPQTVIYKYPNIYPEHLKFARWNWIRRKIKQLESKKK